MVPIAEIVSNTELQTTRIDIAFFFIGVSPSSFENQLLRKVEMTATRPIAIAGIEPLTPFGLNPPTNVRCAALTKVSFSST